MSICRLPERDTKQDTHEKLAGTQNRFEIVHRARVMHNGWRDLVVYPKFTKRLYNQILTLGRSATLEVHVTGFPEPEVRWYKDSLPVVQTATVKMHRPNNHVYVLTIKQIKNAQSCDQGHYTCRASNVAGSVATSAFVHVEKFNSGYRVPPISEYLDCM